MKLIRVGVDLAKSVFQVHGVNRREKAIWRRKLSRADWIKAVPENVPLEAEIGMEACAGAHHWARRLRALGYSVKLIAPQFVHQEQQERRPREQPIRVQHRARVRHDNACVSIGTS